MRELAAGEDDRTPSDADDEVVPVDDLVVTPSASSARHFVGLLPADTLDVFGSIIREAPRDAHAGGGGFRPRAPLERASTLTIPAAGAAVLLRDGGRGGRGRP